MIHAAQALLILPCTTPAPARPASADRTPVRAALLDNHLTHLPPGLAVALADLYEMDPQAHAALLLALTRVPPADVAVFLAEDLESFSAALERHHDLAPKILVAWEWALVSRRPFETLGEIARRLTSERYVRDLRRSLNRDVLRAMQRGADPAGPINDRPGETFRARLQKAFWWLLYYGSDYRRDRNPLEYEFIARQAAARLSARAPAFAFREHGVAGVLTGWLYAQSAMERMVVPYRNIEPLDMNARQRFGRDRASGGRGDDTRRRVDADNLRGSAPQQSHAPSGQPTPEPTQSPSLLQHIEAFVDTVISQAGFAVQSAWEMPLPFDPLRMPQTQAAPLGRSQVLASRIRAERARKDAVGNLKTDVNPLSPSAASRRLGPVITAQFFRMHAQDKLRQTLAPLLDIKRFLANRFKDGSYPLAANLNPDGWFLKRFTLWQYHPDRDAFTRHQSAQQGALYSKSLTQAALDIFTIDPPFDNLREEYGIYARNRTGSTIFEPAEELKGMSAEQFVEISRQAKKEFHRRRLALEQVTPGELAALDLRAHRITMLEQDASLAYFAGKLSSRAHALVQTICYAPSQPMRDAADSFIHEIQGYELEIEVPGAGPRHYPAGAFVIGIPSTGMARRPASIVLHLEYIKSNDPAVRATLLKQIRTQEGVELSLRAKVAARWFGQEVDDLGGEFIEFAQADFLHTTTDGSQGLCLAFARAMAIAIDEARVSSLIMNVQSAVDTPSAPVAKALRDALTSLQMNPGASATESHLEFLDFEAISDKLLNTQTRGTFLVQTMSHAMTLVLNDVSAFFDPNFGLGRFASREALVEFLGTHLGKPALLKRYGAYGTPMTPSFAFKQVDIDALREVPLTAPGFAKTADLLRPWTEPAV